MALTLFLVLAALVAFASISIVLIRRRPESETPDADWFQNFSADKYRPMQRLLDERDYIFLKAQPGYHPSIARNLRRQRQKVYRAYLRSLVKDFNRFHAAAVAMLLTSETDRPELAVELTRIKAQFQMAVFAVRVRLVMNSVGLVKMNGSAPAEALRALETATRELRLQPISN